MKQIKYLLISAFIGLVLSGCTSTSVFKCIPVKENKVNKDGHKIVAQLKGSNVGYFLFNGIPLYSGVPHRPNRREYKSFENRVKPKHIEIMFDSQLKYINANGISDLEIKTEESGWHTLGIIWTRKVEGKAFAIKKSSTKSK
jgi:hypothetical protein